MKILHLIQTSGPGGAEKLVLTLAQSTKHGHTSTVGLLRDGWLCTQLRSRGVEVKLIPSGGPFDIRLVRNLASFITKRKFDIVHSHLLDMNLYSSLAARIARVPLVATEHGDVHHASKKINAKTSLKVKALSRLSSKLVFVSAFTKKSFLRISPVSEKKAAVVFNGINLEEYGKPINIRGKKAELGLDGNDFIIGNVANLYPVKGQSYLLKAFGAALKALPDAKLLIVGRGELEHELKREAHQLGISRHVRFLGFREDVKELLKIMDLFILPSLSEGLPFSLVEATACKVPVIAADVGGIPEVIDNGITGFLVPAADTEALCKRIIDIAGNTALAGQLALRSYEKITRQFSLRHMIDQYERIYSELA